LTVKGTSKGDQIRLFAANVYEKNGEFSKLLDLIRSCDPDIVFLVETDQGWQDALRPLDEAYPHSLTHPLDNTYGLLFYSKFELSRGAVRFIVLAEVPSVEALVKLLRGKRCVCGDCTPSHRYPGK